MNRNKADMIIAAISALRESVDDETALTNKAIYPEWRPNTSYAVDDRVQDGENLYKRIQPQASPEAEIYPPHEAPALWVRVWVEEWPEWVQPTGAHDAYNTGDKVSHNGKHWVCTMNACVYEPGVFGWDVVE